MLNEQIEQNQSYSVILTYEDGSKFECAEGVTHARALEIKANAKKQIQAKELAFFDVVNIAIIPSTTGGLYA